MIFLAMWLVMGRPLDIKASNLWVRHVCGKPFTKPTRSSRTCERRLKRAGPWGQPWPIYYIGPLVREMALLGDSRGVHIHDAAESIGVTNLIRVG